MDISYYGINRFYTSLMQFFSTQKSADVKISEPQTSTAGNILLHIRIIYFRNSLQMYCSLPPSCQRDIIIIPFIPIYRLTRYNVDPHQKNTRA